jgi:hypothetical protein
MTEQKGPRPIRSAEQQRLLRQLEGHMRQCKARTDIRWQLTQAGMTADDIWRFECTVRRRIREERTARTLNAQEAAA